MPETMILNNEEIRPGEHKAVHFFVAKLPTHTVIDLPVHIYRGKQDGPVLLMTAGMHGDEINGIEIIRRLIRSKKIFPTAGTVIAIPVVNIFGFIHFSRDLPDGKDLNRSFPGTSTGSLAGRIAYLIVKEIMPHVDAGVDFHTGGASRTNYPQVRCVFENRRSLKLARAFAPPFVLNSSLIDKSFRKAASKLGKPVIVYEAGETLRFDEYAIEEGMRGTRRLMRHMGMIKKSAPAKITHVLSKKSWIRASSAGIFESIVKCGDKIRVGQVLAQLADPFGDSVIYVTCKKTGYIIGMNNNPVVNRGDALFHIGYER